MRGPDSLKVPATKSCQTLPSTMMRAASPKHAVDLRCAGTRRRRDSSRGTSRHAGGSPWHGRAACREPGQEQLAQVLPLRGQIDVAEAASARSVDNQINAKRRGGAVEGRRAGYARPAGGEEFHVEIRRGSPPSGGGSRPSGGRCRPCLPAQRCQDKNGPARRHTGALCRAALRPVGQVLRQALMKDGALPLARR